MQGKACIVGPVAAFEWHSYVGTAGTKPVRVSLLSSIPCEQVSRCCEAPLDHKGEESSDEDEVDSDRSPTTDSEEVLLLKGHS